MSFVDRPDVLFMVAIVVVVVVFFVGVLLVVLVVVVVLCWCGCVGARSNGLGWDDLVWRGVGRSID
jgi:hypothetical protein